MPDYSFSCYRTPVAATWRCVRAFESDGLAVRDALSMLEAEADLDTRAASWIEVGRVGARGEYLKLGTWRWVRGAPFWASVVRVLDERTHDAGRSRRG